jgi:rod shape-determining protein MreD
MKVLGYAALILLLVPLQVVLVDRITLFDVRPDLGLVAVCLIGLYGGEMDALLAGIAIGFAQDLFSGGGQWGNLCLKPMLGLIVGLASRNLVNLTGLFAVGLILGLSVLSGTVMYLLKAFTGPGASFFLAAHGIILPQACYDALVGLALLKILQRWRAPRMPKIALSYE